MNIRIRICGYYCKLPNYSIIIDTTSRSTNWSKGLSPFYLGPVITPHGISKNVENAWQYSKVYSEHINDGEPNSSYWTWLQEGFKNKRGVRYPMGKGAKPVYSYWNGQHLSYIEARKHIYCPLYSEAVRNTEAFKTLQNVVANSKYQVWLKDFDGYDHKALGMSYQDVINCESRKMGHAFVLGMMLENQEVWL